MEKNMRDGGSAKMGTNPSRPPSAQGGFAKRLRGRGMS